MEDEDRCDTLRYNRNKSTIGGLLAVISVHTHRISSYVVLNAVFPPFLAPPGFAESHRHCNSPSMTSKSVASAMFGIDFVGESKVLTSWRAEFDTSY